ncbi:uncharacterized protein LOC141608011 [Silene latifolia]|uniref:uncharacterized protein LOC141608011 n=1 Tax=Silene latifolia TaxID=37657 RepID=UPI003D77EAE4
MDKRGNSNSAFFHGLLTARKHGNKVLRVEDANGTVCDTPEQIQSAFLGYYRQLLGTSYNTKRVHRSIIKHGPCCSPEDCASLLRPISREEVRKAMFSIPDIKSRGPDGYTSKFFKDAWGEIGGRGHRMSPSFIPLPVVMCVYKVISKLMCARLAEDLIGLYERPNASARCLFKIDLQKAYDTVEWSFVEQLLSMLKFPIEFHNMTTRLKKVDCACLVEKICYRIHSYGARKFSYAGRLVLVKSVLTYLHSYWASMFVLPKGIIKAIEATCRNFLWDNGTEYKRVPLVSWDRICSPKEEGGLGLRDLGVWNKAMVGRLVAWVAEKKDTIWVHWVQHNHVKGKEWMDYIPPASSSWVWRRICSLKQDIIHGFVDGKWVVQPDEYTPTGCYEWLKDSRPTVPWHKVEDKCLLCGQAEENMAHLGGSKVQQGVHAALVLGAIYRVWSQRNQCRVERVVLLPEWVAEEMVQDVKTRIRGRENLNLNVSDIDGLY